MKNILSIALLLFFMSIMNSCMEEEFPTNSITDSQIGKSSAAMDALAEATATYMYKQNDFGLSGDQEYGYNAQMRVKDELLGDSPCSYPGFDYMSIPWGNLRSLASGNEVAIVWRFYYTLIFNAHNLMNAVEAAEADGKGTLKSKHYYANSLLHRALAYLDMVRMYEFKKTGIPILDDEADQNELWGLTVPLVTQTTTSVETQNNPRRMYYEMYRFILTDLNKSEEYFDGYSRSKKNWADLSVVHAYKARFWMELATRFRKFPEDMTTQLSHENDPELEHYDKLDISSAEDCYNKALDYSRKVINAGYSPLTKAQWHNTKDGFNNSLSNSSWVFATIIPGPEEVRGAVYYSFIGSMSPEYDGGVATTDYNIMMVSKDLFDRIDEKDWRKTTWIDPEDQGEAPDKNKYATLLPDEDWMKCPSYANFKFRPKDGLRFDDKGGGATHLPVVRVEEMYFIEAEALAYTQGFTSGVNALQSFINTYRYDGGGYTCQADNIDDFIVQDLLVQKRIEFWGEGILYYDYKRHSLPISRGYPGTNYSANFRYNSIPGYGAPWLNFRIPNSGEINRNRGCKQNPDPNVRDNVELWIE